MKKRRDLLADLPTRDIFITFAGTLAPLIAIIVALAVYGDDAVTKGVLLRPALYVLKDYLYVVVIGMGVYLLGIRRTRVTWAIIGFRQCSVDWIVKAFLLAILLYWVQVVVNTSWTAAGFTKWADAPRENDIAVVQASSTVTIIALSIVVAMLTPIAVEVFSRGLVFAWMRRNLDFTLSAIASSIVFGVIHVEVVKYGQAVVFGIVAAYLYDRSSSLWPPIVLHLTVNSAYMIGVLRLASFI